VRRLLNICYQPRPIEPPCIFQKVHLATNQITIPPGQRHPALIGAYLNAGRDVNGRESGSPGFANGFEFIIFGQCYAVDGQGQEEGD